MHPSGRMTAAGSWRADGKHHFREFTQTITGLPGLFVGDVRQQQTGTLDVHSPDKQPAQGCEQGLRRDDEFAPAALKLESMSDSW
jgi:hypothetical protein